MNIEYSENKIILHNISGFDLKKTFECGQCFRFDSSEYGYTGVAHGRLLSLCQKDGAIEIEGITRAEFENVFCDFFDLERDYSQIDKVLSQDPVLTPVIPFSTGIRILKQEPFETLVSFIISASNNIPRIKKIINLLCENFGKKQSLNGHEFYSFPSAKTLASIDLSQLAVIRAGYRDKYILDCAKKVYSGEISLEKVKSMSYTDAARELMKINGVGQKVADCALLFGFGFLESFPKDVWIKRILQSYYGTQDNAKIPFYGYDGIAQQYLFYYARENSFK